MPNKSSSQLGPIAIVKRILQNNLAGNPIIHKQTEWDFDPDVAIKRREQFYELHGYRAGKLIERLGVGIDGKSEERRKQQQIRDSGLLDGALPL